MKNLCLLAMLMSCFVAIDASAVCRGSFMGVVREDGGNYVWDAKTDLACEDDNYNTVRNGELPCTDIDGILNKFYSSYRGFSAYNVEWLYRPEWDSGWWECTDDWQAGCTENYEGNYVHNMYVNPYTNSPMDDSNICNATNAFVDYRLGNWGYQEYFRILTF